jgi:hypothetical protein
VKGAVVETSAFVPPPLTPRGVVNVGPAAVRVELSFRTAFGTPKETEIIPWPEGWRLPQLGESVQLRSGFGGFVQYVDWDLEQGLVRVFLK